MAGNREREFPIGQSAFRDPGVVKASEIVPVPRPAFAAAAPLKAVDVHQRCLLPERALRQHDGRASLWKRKIREVCRSIAHHRADSVGFAGGACPEVDLNLRPYGSEGLEQRFVPDIEPLGFRTNARSEPGAPKLFLDERANPLADPFGQARADRLRPALLLTTRGRQRLVAGTGNQIRREVPDVVGNVDVFRKPPDRAPHLGQGGAALEDQPSAERGVEQDAEGRHDPDILLEQESRVWAFGLNSAQSMATLFRRQALKLRLSHL